MFDGMEEIEGMDPYQIEDLRTGAPGIGSLSQAVTPESMAESKVEAKADWAKSAPKSKPWYEYITSGVQAVGQAAGMQAQAQAMAQLQKLQQQAQAGQLSQQAYQQQLQMLQRRADLVRQQSMQQEGFVSKYKWFILGGVVVAGGAAYWFWWRKRKR